MDAVGGREYIPWEIAQRYLQGPNQTMVSANPLHPGETPTPVNGAVSPSANRVITEPLQGGGRGAMTGSEAIAGAAPTPIPGTVGAGDVRNRSAYTDPSGHATSSTQLGPRGPVRPLGPPATPAPLGTAPNATAPAGGLPPASQTLPPPRTAAPAAKPATVAPPPQVRPFNPTNRTDSIVQAIGDDAANWKLATNAADKFQIGQRMAELGIEPGNITGSMRDRVPRMLA